MLIKTNRTANIIRPRTGDLGFDLVAESDPIFENNYIEYNTGVKLQPSDEHTHFLIFPRSSISKTNLILANHVAIIDASFRGEIKLRFRYIPTIKELEKFVLSSALSSVKGFEIDKDKIYKKGDKIAQGVFFRQEQNIELIQCEFLSETERGSGGFGSTGN